MNTLPDGGLNISFTLQDVRQAVKIFAAANPGEAERLTNAYGSTDGGAAYWWIDTSRGWFESLSQEFPLCTRSHIIAAAHRAAMKAPGILLATLAADLRPTHLRLELLHMEQGGNA